MVKAIEVPEAIIVQSVVKTKDEGMVITTDCRDYDQDVEYGKTGWSASHYACYKSGEYDENSYQNSEILAESQKKPSMPRSVLS